MSSRVENPHGFFVLQPAWQHALNVPMWWRMELDFQLFRQNDLQNLKDGV